MAKLVNLKDLKNCDKQVNVIIDQLLKRYIELGVSYQTLSEISGVSEPTICNVFNKKKRASMTSIVALTNALGLELVVKNKEK